MNPMAVRPFRFIRPVLTPVSYPPPLTLTPVGTVNAIRKTAMKRKRTAGKLRVTRNAAKMPRVNVEKGRFDAILKRMIESPPVKRENEKHPR